jgi:hypothetical protein
LAKKINKKIGNFDYITDVVPVDVVVDFIIVAAAYKPRERK